MLNTRGYLGWWRVLRHVVGDGSGKLAEVLDGSRSKGRDQTGTNPRVCDIEHFQNIVDGLSPGKFLFVALFTLLGLGRVSLP